MKKRIIIKFADDELVLRGHEEPDEYFIDLYGEYVIEIARQYYPLRKNKPEIIFKNNNVPPITFEEKVYSPKIELLIK